MQLLLERETRRGTARIAHTTKADGDLSPAVVAPVDLERRRRAIIDHDWYSVRQVHGAQLRWVDAGADPSQRPEADALATELAGRVLVVHAGDCVPVGIVHEAGAVAAVHAGWKGLVAGVIEATVEALVEQAGPGELHAAVGPHIRAARYEFGAEDLATVERRYGAGVRSQTVAGTPALDLTAGVCRALTGSDVAVSSVSPDCTAAEAARYWSHRARGEAGRLGLMAWLVPDE